MQSKRPFSGKESTCRKCRGGEILLHYCGGRGTYEKEFGCMESGEHFHRICKGCGFKWLENMAKRRRKVLEVMT